METGYMTLSGQDYVICKHHIPWRFLPDVLCQFAHNDGQKEWAKTGAGKLFCLADQFKSEKFSRTGLKNKHKYSAIKFYFSSYHNSDSRSMILCCSNQTLPSGPTRRGGACPPQSTCLGPHSTSSLY